MEVGVEELETVNYDILPRSFTVLITFDFQHLLN